MTTPNFNEAINKLIDAKLLELNTSMPAEVVSYDYDKNLAVVKPVIKRKYKGESEPVELPTISNVPVMFPRLGPAHLRLPVKPKQTGELFFNQRSIDKWLSEGGIVDPLDGRRHDLSDAVFYPGLATNKDPMQSSAASDSIELKLNGSYFEILNSGKFKVTNGTEELFDLLVQLMGEMISEMEEQGTKDFTNTVFGPMQPINSAAYTGLKTKYQTLKTKLESLKG